MARAYHQILPANLKEEPGAFRLSCAHPGLMKIKGIRERVGGRYLIEQRPGVLCLGEEAQPRGWVIQQPEPHLADHVRIGGRDAEWPLRGLPAFTDRAAEFEVALEVVCQA